MNVLNSTTMRYMKSTAKWIAVWLGSQFVASIALPGAGLGDERTILTMLIVGACVAYAMVQARVAREIGR